MRFFARVFVLFCLALPCAAQNKEPDIKFRLAQSYEQSGDFESAVKLYEEVLARDSTNFLVIDALHRDYIQLKKYDAAIELVSRVIRRSPADILWLSRLGALYNLKGDDAKATAAWERAIAVDPVQEGTYRGVASSMMESRLFDRAIEMYQRGRTACKNPNLFAVDIAYLYAITLNYSAATKEYLNLLRQNAGQMSYIQSRIASYIVRPDGLKAATTVVEEAAQSEKDNQFVQQLLAWLYMESKGYDRAYEVYRRLDTKLNGGGHEIFNFAERAFRERGYSAAGTAYREIISRFPKFDQIAQVKFGNARTLEELALLADTTSPFIALYGSRLTMPPLSSASASFDGAIAAYKGVVDEFPRTDFASRSLYRIAVLRQERYFDLAGSLQAIESVEKNAPSASVLLDAVLRKGDIFLTMGDLARATEVYGTLTAQQAMLGDQRERAALRLAEIAYFQGAFPDALSKLELLTRNAGADITNDALRLQIFVHDNSTEDEAGLKEFAKGELLAYQRKFTEALAVFQSFAKSFPTSELCDEALISAGGVETALRRYADAIITFERIGHDFPESVLLDAALMNTGSIHETGLHDKPGAIAAYQKLLERFPNSLYVNEARKRIRELRGDVL